MFGVKVSGSGGIPTRIYHMPKFDDRRIIRKQHLEYRINWWDNVEQSDGRLMSYC